MPDNFRTVYRDLPYKCRGFIIYCSEDDYYTVVLNSRMSYQIIKNTFMHELEHIKQNDIFSLMNANDIELQRH